MLLIFMAMLMLFACSTEKNTFINRTYHSTTARYNGYFNAKELIREGLENYRSNYREDYYNILPVERYPTEEDVSEMYPIIDTAISKCKKVISKHSMPTASKPSQKKTEYANWIDMNWLMIGKLNYVRRDYEAAYKNFDYVRKFYTDRPSNYSGQLWKAKTEIAMGDLTEAGRTLQKLDLMFQNKQAEKGDKIAFKEIFDKRKRKEKKEDKLPDLPKDFEFELAKVKAELALEKDNYEEAVKQLKIALDEAFHKEDKARISFIIGQILQEQNNPEARKYYTKSIKKNAPFEMSFHAKINRAIISDLNDEQMIAELKDMAKEQKYLEFRDQIYYAMAEIELGRNDVSQAKQYLTKSVFYSLNNPRQKGISYETLGDLSFKEKEYVSAQKYYDSSARVIPDTYVNAEEIRSKADNLSKLVEAITTVSFEDSVQRIARMDEDTREKYLKDVIKQLKKEEQLRKEQEAKRAEEMRKLQQSYAAQNAGRGNKWYFSNQKAMQEGLEEFRRVWGQRANEDNWRYTNIPAEMNFDNLNDTLPEDSLLAENNSGKSRIEDMTTEDLMKDIPLSDSAMKASNEKLIAALYESGMIYKEQLNEKEMGAKQFKSILERNVENKHNLLAAFQLYKINEGSGSAGEYKEYILNNYPNSDYANYLRDPDYFIKKKERDALALKEYLRSVERYERGLYYPIVMKADDVIANESDNPFRKEYYLLKAMAMGHLNNDKSTLIPVLQKVISEYPETDVAHKAEEMLKYIQEGVPEFKPFDLSATSQFQIRGNDKFFVLIYLPKGGNQTETLRSVSDFNREFFSRSRLSPSPVMYSPDMTFIQVKEFESTAEAKEYIRTFKKTKKHLEELRNNDILFISKENFKTLVKEKALEDYERFYQVNY
ncbi:MAG: hypothetical protein R3277_10950 [Brumimicrobium sp.]|nr:hypothetical protein [Brumimicrobium sp.]